MPNTTRSAALTTLRVAGYHDDQKLFLRTYVENAVAIGVATAEYRRGALARRSGLPCRCAECARAQMGAAA